MGEGFRHIDAYKNNPEFDPVTLCHIVRDSCVKRQKEYGLSDDIGDIFMAESEYAHNFRGMDRIEESFAYGTKKSAGSVRAFRTEMTIS